MEPRLPFGVLLIICTLLSHVHSQDIIQCPGNTIRFNNACYTIKTDGCPPSHFLINNSCCIQSCVSGCMGEKCMDCCVPASTNAPVTNNNQACQNSASSSCTNCAQNQQCSTCVQTQQCSTCVQNQQCSNCVQTQKCSNCVQTQPCTQTCNQIQTNCGSCSTGNQCSCQNTPCNQPPSCQTCNPPYNPPIPNPPSTPTNPPTEPPTTTTERPTTTTERTTTTTPPPDPIMCPPGTIPIGKRCQILYCPYGTVLSGGSCIQIVCPAGTTWTGEKCSMIEPIVHNISVYNNIVTHSNHSQPDITLNTANNIVINAPVTINGGQGDVYDDDDCDEVPDTTEATTQTPTPTTATPIRCCTVMTPRTCEQRNGRWYCYSRKYKKCGEFCTATTIYLKPPRVYTHYNRMIIPPLQMGCGQANGNCGGGGFDCSGCGLGIVQSCNSYCYRYACPSHSCNFYDQQRYCLSYPGSYGCMAEDGCYDQEWCSTILDE